MAHWRRRSVLSTGVALATGATLASVGTAGADATTANVEAATAGDERGWSSARGNAGNTAFVPAEGSFPEPEGIAWTYDRTGDLAAVDGAVYLRTGSEVHAVDDADGELLAVDAADGSTAWRRERVALERSAANVDVDDADVGFAPLPVAVAGGTVYAAVGEGTGYDGTAGFAALEATTGETRWTYWEPWRWDPHGYVIAVGDRVYTGSISDGETHPVLDAETGAELERLTVRFPPAMTDETRVATDRHGISSAGHGESERWRERGGTDAWRRPVIVGETVVVPYYPGDETVNALYGFDLEDGTERWTFTHADVDVADLSERYAASEDTIYVSAGEAGGDERLVAIRAGDAAANDGNESEEGADGDESGADETSTDDAEDDPRDDPDDGAEERSNDDAGNEPDAETDDAGDSGDEPGEGDSESDEVDPEPDETAAETDDENASVDVEDGDLEDGSQSDGTDSSDDASSDGSVDGTTADAEGSSEGESDGGDNPGVDGTVDGADDGYAGEEAGDDANATDDGPGGTDGGSDGSTADGGSDDPRGVDENSSATDQGGEDAETAAADTDGMPGFTAGWAARTPRPPLPTPTGCPVSRRVSASSAARWASSGSAGTRASTRTPRSSPITQR
ncbi:outer membrane protein assembly factor BamB family protein [Natronococcus jeotgali]|uniref:Pyrrolo-quinoline quinone n=1 Tax=Natronococcus jeotgali DSM 18795 TaxID=1227498 RepID=L9XWU2_9EURY|nr:PQQ-binding-like beta-propeller repeat protein [Natronococcus jeotgali]ELY66240.1 pyrrolo-quinoline quinone [Natronococcus jeotgali DSM 18795]